MTLPPGAGAARGEGRRRRPRRRLRRCHGGAVIENEHSGDVESLAPPLRVYMSIQPEGKACFNFGRVLVVMDPLAW